jgi:predicted negative regulator of RcsB-dependent stress response
MTQIDDDAQVEQLRRWWQENWKALVAGLVIGLGGIFGWEAWQAAKQRTAEQASQIYEDLKRAAISRPDRAVELGHALVTGYARTPYAAQAALLLSQIAVQTQDWSKAEEHLRWVLTGASDDGLRKIARLRLARVLWQQNRADEAIALLNLDSADPFAPLFLELRGDIRLAAGDRAAARADYEKALQLGAAATSSEFLRYKLDDLADVDS